MHIDEVELMALSMLQVGEDVVAELARAMERQGLNMRVSALVSSLLLVSNSLCDELDE